MGAGLALCMLACAARAAGFSGVYTYKLVLRDDQGLALRGAENTPGGDERVSSNYKVEVYNAAGGKINATLRDWHLGSDRSEGCNCILDVPVGEQSGSAKVGERLTLVLTPVGGSERFRSSKVLPPVGGTMGIAGAPVGAFWSDSTDTDNGWDAWLREVERYLGEDTPVSIGGADGDYDDDGLSNMREYQLGTDPAGGELGLVNKPEFSIVETDGVYRVSFNHGWGHVYSIRAIEGYSAVGVDGRDLALYESIENLNGGTEWGTYFFDGDYNVGTKEFFVKKPTQASFLIGLAVDGRLQEYIQVGSAAVAVTPGYPVAYDTEAAATAAKAIANVVPSEAVAAVLTGDGMADGYKTKFTAEVKQENDKWFLSAELTPQAWTNLMENATAATRQVPVAEISLLPPEATTNIVLTGCTPGFYYSLYCGASLTSIAPDAEAANLNVLGGADGVVEFPMVKKPSEAAGFYNVVISY